LAPVAGCFAELGFPAVFDSRSKNQSEAVLANKWGVELTGETQDKDLWLALLKAPFDPYVEQVDHESGNYLALRSSAFDFTVTTEEVRKIARELFVRLNMAMAANERADPISVGAVVEFSADGPARRHIAIEVEGVMMRMRAGIVMITAQDPEGNIIEPEPAPSRIQDWIRAADQNAPVATAMRYMSGKPSWVELYKAHEVLSDSGLASSVTSAAELKRFTHTANTAERHRADKFQAPAKPMMLWEGQALMMRWLTAAIEEVLRAHRSAEQGN
jgi:hypothetical protein